MKRLVVLCALLALLAPGCKKKKPEDKAKGDEVMAPTKAGPMTPAERPPAKRPVKKLSNVQIVLAGFAAFSAGKLDDATKGFGAAGEWHSIGAPPPHNVLKGAAAIKTYFQLNKSVFDMKATPVRVFDGGDHVVVEAVITGTHKADFMGVKATNKPIGLKAAYWFQLKDGMVTKMYAYVDMRTLMVQIGALKGKMAMHVTKALPAPTGKPEIVRGKADPKALATAKEMMKLKPTDKAYAKIVDANTVMEMANARTMKGLKASQQSYAKMSKSFGNEKMESQAAVGVGQWALLATLDSVTLKKTKKVLTAHRLYIGHFVDGKLKYGIAYQNAMEVGMQMGLVKMPKPGMAPAAMAPAAMKPAPKKKAPKKKGM